MSYEKIGIEILTQNFYKSSDRNTPMINIIDAHSNKV